MHEGQGVVGVGGHGRYIYQISRGVVRVAVHAIVVAGEAELPGVRTVLVPTVIEAVVDIVSLHEVDSKPAPFGKTNPKGAPLGSVSAR